MALASTLPPPTAEPIRTGLIRAEGRAPEVVAFEENVVSFFLDAAHLLGVPKSVAAIYGVCFASPQALSFAELNARLDISIGSISQGVRVLREMGALKEVSTAEDRFERFEPDLALRKLAAHWLEKRLGSQLQSGRQRLQAVARAVPPGDAASDRVLRSRLKQLQTWHDKARALLPIMRTFLKIS